MPFYEKNMSKGGKFRHLSHNGIEKRVTILNIGYSGMVVKMWLTEGTISNYTDINFMTYVIPGDLHLAPNLL